MSTQPKPRGGARAGAGRKPGQSTRNVTFSLPITTIAALAGLPNKSQFVNEAIVKALHLTAKTPNR